MKTLLICLVLLASGFGAANSADKVRCPIMKDRLIDKADALKKKLYVDYKGKRYFLCCKTCVTLFKRSPGKYANASGDPVAGGR